MKPHPRIRKTIKWGGAAVTVLLLILWVASAWYGISIRGRPLGFLVVQGGLVSWTDDSPTSSWGVHSFARRAPDSLPFMWAYGWGDVSGYHQRLVVAWLAGTPHTNVWVVVWLPLVIIALPTGAAWWLDARAARRENSAICPKCRYDRTGLAVGAKCPECGCLPRSGAPHA